MDLRKLKTLIELVETSGIAELEIQESEERVRITRALTAPPQTVMMQAAPQASALGGPASPPVPRPPESAPATASSPEGHVVKSPMVGTFYRASSPTAEPYVREGDMVKEGQIVCIIEAMKLMNEIEAKVPGRVAKILVENGQPVEYGQPLLLIEPSR